MVETLPTVKWVPTFKVECRRLGYVDDLTRRTHGRCYDDVWDIVLKPESKHVVSYKWICKIKYVADRSKEILVARGFYKKEGINFEETLTPGSKVHFLQNYDGSCFHDEVKTILP